MADSTTEIQTATVMPDGRCQVCGAPHDAEDPILCAVCGEPVLLLGWVP